MDTTIDLFTNMTLTVVTLFLIEADNIVDTQNVHYLIPDHSPTNKNLYLSFSPSTTDLISLSSDFVEPLQIVSYTGGQKFDLHHDAGTIMDDGEIEIVQPRRYTVI